MPAVIFAGTKVKALKSELDLNGGSSVITGTVDPSSVATSANKGSLYLNTSSGLVYRKTDNGSSTNWSLINAGSGIDVYRDVTTTDSPSTSDQTLNLSGASFTVTLPSAAGITGKTFCIVHSGTSLSQVYTIDGSGSETIGGLTTYLLHTAGEKLTIISDGTNWAIKGHETVTPWTAFTGTSTWTTNVTSNSGYWRRIGDTIEVEQTVLLSGAPDATGLIHTVPFGLAINTAKLSNSGSFQVLVGSGVATDVGVAGYNVSAAFVDSTSIQVFSGVLTGGFLSYGGLDHVTPFTFGSTDTVQTKYIVPITGWNA